MEDSCSNCTSCSRMTMEEQYLIYDAKWWMEGVIQITLAVIGVSTNLVSIYVLSRRELVNTFNQLLIALAIFDVLYLIVMFIDSLGLIFIPYYGDGYLPDWYKLLTPYILYPGKAISLTCSIFMMVSIGVERCMAVFFPFSRIPLIGSSGLKSPCYKKRLFVYIFPVLFFSIFLNIFKFLESKAIWKEGRVKVEIREIRYDPTYLTINSWVRLVVLGVLPVGAIVSLNCCIYWAVRKARLDMSGERAVGREEGKTKDVEMKRIVPSMRKTVQIAAAYKGNRWKLGTRSKKLSASEQRLSIVLMMIAIIFIVSSLPRIIIMMYDIIIIDTVRSCIDEGFVGEGFPVWNHILGSVSHVLLCFVPTENFLVYCLVGNKFRRVARKYMYKLCCCSRAPSPTISPRQGSLRSSCKTTSLRGSVKRNGSSKIENETGV